MILLQYEPIQLPSCTFGYGPGVPTPIPLPQP